MKTTRAPKSTDSGQHSSKPFFNKTGKGSFFSSSLQKEGPVFSPLSINSKVAIDQPKQPTIQRTEDEPTAMVPHGGGTYTVVAGDTLWDIAERTYGHGRYWRRIRDANIGQIHKGGQLIYPNTVLNLPEIAIADTDVLGALQDVRGDDDQLVAISQSVGDANYETFISGLSEAEREAHAEFLQRIEMMRSSGMTMEELSEAQRLFMEGEATRAGVSIGQYIHDQTQRGGYGGGTATWWPSLTPAEQTAWEARFDAVVSDLRTISPPSIQAVIVEATANGGGNFVWDPAGMEVNGAFAFTRIGTWNLWAGRRFVEAAEADLASVYPNIIHEMGGHNEYGTTYGSEIMTDVLNDIPAAERTIAESGGNSIFSTYSYMETELFSELREQEFARSRTDNPTDYPFDAPVGGHATTNDVKRQLENIKARFAPVVADALVRGLWRRAQLEDNITDEARDFLGDRINQVYGFDPR